MCFRKRPLPSVTDGLYSEAVAAGFSQSLDFVGVTGSTVDCHKPGQKKKAKRKAEAMNHKTREKPVIENWGEEKDRDRR